MASVTFSSERALQEKKQALLRELEKVNSALEELSGRKGLLALDGDSFREKIIRLLNGHFGLRVEVRENSLENFWIADPQGNDLAMGEILASRNAGLQKHHVSRLVMHREEKQLADNFPTLLIVNCLSSPAPEANDQEIPPDVITKAVREHVLLVRTVDLLQFLDIVETGKAKREEFLAIVLNKVGWLRVTDTHWTIEREGSPARS